MRQRVVDDADTAMADTVIEAALRADPSVNLVYWMTAECAGAAVAAARAAGMTGKVDIIGMHNEQPTLAGIKAGTV